MSGRVTALGGRIVVPAAPERRNRSLAVIGVGVSAGAPTRWRSGASGAPPVFVRGPAF